MPSNIVKTIAKKCGKSVAEVEKIWQEVKDELHAAGEKESDKDFYLKLVGRVKFRLSKSCLDNLGWKSSRRNEVHAKHLLPILQRFLN